MNTLLARDCGDLSTCNIDIVFLSQPAFEPQIKSGMHSTSNERPETGRHFNSPGRAPMRSAATLKIARFPDYSSFVPLTSCRNSDDAGRGLKQVEFFVELPDAKTVQLAADFTDWDEAPLDMIRFDGGIWSATVSLPAGIYTYRFLADGEWYDDPRAVRRYPGSLEACVQVK